MECDKKCSCCEKTTARNDDEKKKLLNRLSRIEGQIRGLKGMVENDSYCADILTQTSAVSSALNSFSRDLLSKHIHSCVVRDLKNGDESVIEELTELIAKMMK